MARPSRSTRVFQPGDMVQLTQAKVALEGAGIPYVVENELGSGLVGAWGLGPFSMWVTVAAEDADQARQTLAEWFDDLPEDP